jgi:diguanylate cyclase (GGDEF)-like protein
MSTLNALIGIAFVSCVMSLVVFGSLFRLQIPGVRRWCVACLLCLGALALLFLGRTNLVVLSAGMLVLMASLLLLQGVRQFFYLPASNVWERGAGVLVLFAFAYWIFIAPDIDARAVVVSGFLAYVRFEVAWLVFRHRPPGRPRYSYYFVMVVAMLGACVHVVRALASALGLMHETAVLQNVSLNVVFLSVSTLTLPCMAIGMVMLAHERLAERMERLANIDSLTGLLVRRAFVVQANEMLRVAKLEGSRLSVAILDVDHFKRINDRYGHAAGDEALVRIAELIKRGMRPDGIVGRIGGEEFAVLLPEKGKEAATTKIDKLRSALAKSVAADENEAETEPVYTFSAGVEEYADGDTLDSLMARADAALYMAKAEGRNRVKVACGMGTAAH